MAAEVQTTSRRQLIEAGLSSLPDEWDVAVMGSMLAVDRGISVGVMYPGDHDPNGIPLVKAGDLVGNTINPSPDFRISRAKHAEYRRTEFQGGEILMTLVGDVGSCAVVPEHMAGWNAARAVAVIRLQDASDARFVMWCLRSPAIRHTMDVWCNTTVQATLNLKEIRQIALPWPAKRERDAIACILGSLDDKIELNRRRSRTLEEMARAIFQSWFVDFDPVRAKAAGQAPPGLKPELAALFPDRLEDSPLGPIPEGWRACRWGDIATLEYGKSLRDYSTGDGLYRVYGTNGPIGWHSKALWNGPGVIIGRKGAYRGVHYSPRPFFVIDTAFFLKPQRTIDMKWAYYELLRCDINSMDSGSAIPSTSRSDFYSLPICVPSEDILAAFGRIVGRFYEQMDACEQQNQTLAELRDVLLPKLISGTLRVPDGERILEDNRCP